MDPGKKPSSVIPWCVGIGLIGWFAYLSVVIWRNVEIDARKADAMMIAAERGTLVVTVK